MQKLAEICVHRPVFATMLICRHHGHRRRVVLHPRRRPLPAGRDAGGVGQTTNPGATPENIETEVTDRIEAAVNTVAGIDELRSTSTEGHSRVTISFDLSKNPDVAAQEVRAKVDPVIRDLPETADPPVVQKQDPDSVPIMMFSISAPMPVVELTTFLEQNVQKRLESVNGVGEVLLFGARRREIQVQIDPDRLNAYGLSTTDVAAALRGAEPRAARRPSRAGHARALRPHRSAACATPDALRRSRRRDARQHADPHPRHRLGRRQRRGSDVGLDAQRPARADRRRAQAERRQHRRAGRRASRRGMAEIQQTLPPNVQVRLVRDDSEFIQRLARTPSRSTSSSAASSRRIIVLIFLRNFRSTLIAAIAIPTSIIGAFALIAALGFTLNQMTMLALTLMVGIVIDDAIVVLENIYRFVEEKGMSPFQAAIEGTREIGLAVMATTLSLLAVFIPVGFMGGIVGRFMSSFGLTVGGGDRDQPDRLVHADADAGGALDQAQAQPRTQQP